MIERWIRQVGLGAQRRPLRQQLRRLIGLCTALTLLLSVLATLLVGIGRRQPLFLGFATIGLWVGWRMWKFARRGPSRPDWALRQHYQSMLGAGIATQRADYSLRFNLGMAWHEFHGPVPLVKETGMLDRALKFLLRLRNGHPVRRLNWSLTVNPRLDVSAESLPEWAPDRTTVTAENAGQKVYLRIELQPLHRLPRSNAIVVRAANPARLAQIRALVNKLDQPPLPGSSAASGNIHVVYLKNADAAKLAVTLRAAMASMGGSAAGSGGGGGATSSLPTSGGASATAAANNTSLMGNNTLGGSNGGLGAGASPTLGQGNQPSTGGLIQADPSTNSLIITAPDPLYRQLRQVIDQLDGRRAQVLVESLIVEVSTNKLAEFGVQWQTIAGTQNLGVVGALGSNFTNANGGGNILGIMTGLAQAGTSTGNAAAAKALSSVGQGFNVALAPRINGQYYLGALANFLQQSGDANVLSTPNLMTLDNEEAKIIIGENVPFPTGSYANATNAGGTVNPFTTVERKDVGLMLRVRPQINENGTVKLSIYQEASKVDESTLGNTNGPRTTKRSIESNVLVEDGSIIVIGGLLDDSYAESENKVPLMGDLPLVGNLFRSENRQRRKTNLMVFLRPTVMRDAASSEALAIDRYEVIRAQQKNLQPATSHVLGINQAPILAPLPERPGVPATAVAAPLTSAPAEANAPAPAPAPAAPAPSLLPPGPFGPGN